MRILITTYLLIFTLLVINAEARDYLCYDTDGKITHSAWDIDEKPTVVGNECIEITRQKMLEVGNKTEQYKITPSGFVVKK